MPELRLDPGRLGEFDGKNENLPVYIGIKGLVFDVSARRDLYGPGGMYAIFAGKDVTRVRRHNFPVWNPSIYT
jgi:predicted heme/steroid binding protein